MEVPYKKTSPNPKLGANIFSKLVFWWVFPFLVHKEDINLSSLYDVLPHDQSKFAGERLGREWDRECSKAKRKKSSPKMHRAIRKAYGRSYLFTFLLFMVDELAIRISQTYCLRMVIRSFSNLETSENASRDRFIWAAALNFLGICHLLYHHPVWQCYHMGMNIRIAISALIYRKTLKLSRSAQNNTTIGQIINLLSNDLARMEAIFIFMPYIIVGPLQAGIFFYSLWDALGISALSGLGYIALLMPAQYVMMIFFSKIRSKIAERTDERGRILSEIVVAIRVIKMYGWERAFSEVVERLRKVEIKWIRIKSYLNGVWLSFYFSASKIVILLTLVTFILTQDEAISAEKLFFAVSIFEILKQNMVYCIPLAAAYVAELGVSMSRIEKFLTLEEHDLQLIGTIKPAGTDPKTPRIIMESLTSSWTGLPDESTLKGVNFSREGHQLVMIVGPVGSGKTSFLNTLMGELKIINGKCSVRGQISYDSQESWIFPGSLRQNIVFGKPFDLIRYADVIQVCSLKEDLKQLPYGDNTIVGERGVALSGGQKARVNLARALYKEADIILMDDPLSAVDAKVSRAIFENCIKEYTKDKFRILVTHQTQYLPQADYIIVLDKGQIHAQGTYVELVNGGIDFVSLVASESEVAIKRKESLIASPPEVATAIEAGEKLKGPASQEEAKQGGSVSGSTYKEYLLAGSSVWRLGIVVLSVLLCQGLNNSLDYLLSYWTNEEERKRKVANWTDDSAVPESEYDTREFLSENTFLCIYGGLVVGFFLMTKIRGFSFFNYVMRISVNLHNSMFSRVVRAPIKFFDDNTSGRIMNRFAKDLGAIDELLAVAIFDTTTTLFSLLGVLIIVVVSNYFIILPTIILVYALWMMRRFFINSSRDLKRVEAIAKSPVFTHITSSFQGLTTIRALKSEKELVEKFDSLQDVHSSAWFGFIAANRWFGMWLEIIANVFMILVTASFFIFDNQALVGNIGLALSSTLALTDTFQWGMRQSAETENYMTSVERILEYTKIPSEAPLTFPKDGPPANWPSDGAIKFNHIYLAYDEKDVLKDLNFEIRPREKIGIVGRTGAGKSSIIAALFRLTEPRGELYIDGVRVNEIGIGLHDLRRAISIIPQDPVLFSGTIRYNLDPFDQYNDEEIWRALQEVDLKDAIPALDFKVSDAGGNFSVGQRQLVCLARAILRNNRIIVMDEATANVDPNTDALIQRTIRSKFADCTIITIAHRLHSVMDSDRILVLDNGYIMEYEHPHILLQNDNGYLSSMVKQTGEGTSRLLHQMANEAYEARLVK